MELTRTGTMVPFLEVSIGQPFFAHDKAWIRTSYDAATVLGSTSIKSTGQFHITNVCNFLIDECDREVEALNYSEGK